ncbi:MAG: hypothetical protein OCD00_19250 [Colwellia sp.]
MYILEIVSLLLFLVLIVLGYKKNSRNIMLVASICLLVGLAAPDFVSGLIDGYATATAS